MKAVTQIMFVTATALFFATLSSSCKRDKSVLCNNGAFTNGACKCNIGYEGASCQTVSRSKFLGNWSASENGNITEASQYPVSMQAGIGGINTLAITNFLNYFTTPVEANVVQDSLYIPAQQLQGQSITGGGYILNPGSNGQEALINCTLTNLATGVATTVNVTLR